MIGDVEGVRVLLSSEVVDDLLLSLGLGDVSYPYDPHLSDGIEVVSDGFPDELASRSGAGLVPEGVDGLEIEILESDGDDPLFHGGLHVNYDVLQRIRNSFGCRRAVPEMAIGPIPMGHGWRRLGLGRR